MSAAQLRPVSASIDSTSPKGVIVATITVRNLDDEVQRRLKRRAAASNHSMEAEARAILSAAVVGGDFARAWVAASAEFRGVDLTLPTRTSGREIDLS